MAQAQWGVQVMILGVNVLRIVHAETGEMMRSAKRLEETLLCQRVGWGPTLVFCVASSPRLKLVTPLRGDMHLA
eukprot:1357638-Amphidinium_carterae.1